MSIVNQDKCLIFLFTGIPLVTDTEFVAWVSDQVTMPVAGSAVELRSVLGEYLRAKFQADFNSVNTDIVAALIEAFTEKRLNVLSGRFPTCQQPDGMIPC